MVTNVKGKLFTNIDRKMRGAMQLLSLSMNGVYCKFNLFSLPAMQAELIGRKADCGDHIVNRLIFE